MAGRGNNPKRTLANIGVTCPHCKGEKGGCPYCRDEGLVYPNRAYIKPTYGTRIQDVMRSVPEKYRVIVPGDITLPALADQLEPLNDFTELLAEKLLAAPWEYGDDGEVETGKEHATYENMLLKHRAMMEAIVQGDVKPYPGKRLTPEQIDTKKRQVARTLTRLFTHLAFVVDRNRERPVVSYNEKRDTWYAPRWVAKDVPALLRASFAAAEQMAQLSMWKNKDEDSIASQIAEVLSGAK